MPRAVVLFPNGTFEEVILKKDSYKQISGYVKGSIQLLPHEKGWDARCSAYVNEEGLMLDMSHNSWGIVLDTMGFRFNLAYGVRGPVVLCGKTTSTGEDGALSSVYVDYLKKFKELDDEDSVAAEDLLIYFAKHQKLPTPKRKRVSITEVPPPTPVKKSHKAKISD